MINSVKNRFALGVSLSGAFLAFLSLFVMINSGFSISAIITLLVGIVSIPLGYIIYKIKSIKFNP